MSDRRLGYILISLVLALCLGVYGHFIWISYHPLKTRTLRFPEVGSLAVEDPVRMNGTLVGEIYGFDHDSLGRVLVHIRSQKPIPIRTSSHAAVKVKGVMGERFIEISLGNLGDPLTNPKEIIDGAFEMGPSEAIAYMDLLKEKIIELKDIMGRLKDGSDGKRSFAEAFSDVANKVDTLVYTVLSSLGGMEEGLNAGLDSAARFAGQTAEFTAGVAAAAPKAIEDLNSLLAKIDNVIPKVETLIARVDAVTDGIDKSKLLWGGDVEKAQAQLAEIRKYVDELRREGLPLTVKVKVF
jgi:phospholipid/cholesterol/gamma-HCH transport system substrate-binding protein